MAGLLAHGGCVRSGYDARPEQGRGAPADAGSQFDAEQRIIRDGSSADAQAPDAAAGADAAAPLPNWTMPWGYRKPLTIQAARVAGDRALDAFPVLVSLADDTDLIDHVSQADGRDLRFTDRSGQPLAHEVELFSRDEGRLIAWVRVPSLSPADDTKIYLYYGNASGVDQQDVTGVWEDSFVAVHHMSSLRDSTKHRYHLLKVGDPVQVEGGGIGKGALFHRDSPLAPGTDPDDMALLVAGHEGTREGYALDGNHDGTAQDTGEDDIPELDEISAFTVSAWLRMDGALLSWEGVVGKNGQSTDGWGISTSSGAWTGADSLAVAVGTIGTGGAGDTTAGHAISVDTLFHCAVVFDGATTDPIHIYLNGVEVTTTPYPDTQNSTAQPATPPTAHPVRIGSTPYGQSRDLYGMIDEVRLSTMSRSPEWIRTEYENQSRPADFIHPGTEESRVP